MAKRNTILIIDDAELNREILALILRERYDTLEADNGLEAIEILEREGDKIALILLDIVMPVMNGFEFLKEIQEGGRFNSIPVIFVTSETYKENLLQGVRMGVRDMIAKPFDPALVRNRVDNLIQLTEQRERSRVDFVSAGAANTIFAHKRQTALIVDDVDVNRAIIRGALEDNYDILEAVHGKEALYQIENHRGEIAVVLLDIIMPVMDGVEMMEEANRKGLLDLVPVIAITTEDSMSKLSRIIDLGICEVIHKPFNAAIIKNRVDYMVELFHGDALNSTNAN